MTLVEKDGLAIADVPLSYQSKKLQVAAVNQNAEAILLIPNPCKKACEEALLCDVKISQKINKEVKEIYSLKKLEGALKKSINLLALNVDYKRNTACIYGVRNKKISQITIPKKANKYIIREIGIRAFANCTNLRTITIPKTVVKIGERAFNNTPWLEEQRKKNPLVTINNILIDGETASGDITIPNGVIVLNAGAFYCCENLTSVTIPDSVKIISEPTEDEVFDSTGAFENCTGLMAVTISKNATKIGQCAFYYCSSLTSVTIPNSVTKIDYSAFSNCENLDSITMSNNVTEIGNYAFADCSELKEIVIPKTVKEIGNGAFDGCLKLELKVCGLKKNYPNWKDWGLSESQIEWNCKPKAN